MTASYSIRKLAEDDLERIWLYTNEEWDIEQADKYIRLLVSRFTWISENPLLGKKRDDVKPGYYCYPEGMHLIFYIISTRPETRVFQKPRHPGEGRDPGNSATYWIPAFAGMTEDAVSGWTLTKSVVAEYVDAAYSGLYLGIGLCIQ